MAKTVFHSNILIAAKTCFTAIPVILLKGKEKCAEI
jgi:hypothetical protein